MYWLSSCAGQWKYSRKQNIKMMVLTCWWRYSQKGCKIIYVVYQVMIRAERKKKSKRELWGISAKSCFISLGGQGRPQDMGLWSRDMREGKGRDQGARQVPGREVLQVKQKPSQSSESGVCPAYLRNSKEAALLRSDSRGWGRWGSSVSGARTWEFRPEVSIDQVGDSGDAE